jgi:hypothetical protein
MRETRIVPGSASVTIGDTTYQNGDRVVVGPSAAEQQQDVAADVVFAGHSMVHSGIQPTTVLKAAGRPDLRGYNAGLHRGFYGVTGPFVVDAVIPELQPALVVLGVSIFDLNDNGELLRDTGERYVRALLGRQDVVGQAARVAARHSALFRNKGVLRRPRRLARAVGASVRGTEVVDDDVRDSRNNVGDDGEWLGYSARRFHTTENMRRHLVDGCMGGYDVGGREVANVQTWIRRIQARGPKVALALMRTSDKFWDEIDDGPNRRSESARVIRELASNAGVPLLEPEAPLVDDEHYADIAHLNVFGMQLFSEALGAAMAAAVESGALSLPFGRSPKAQ